MTEQAHARRSDPATSHQAATSLSSDQLTASQMRVLEVVRRYGPMTDERLVEMYGFMEISHQSQSGIRTRRKELADKNLVHDTCERAVTNSGRKAILWGYGPDPVKQHEHDDSVEQEPLFS